MKLLGKTYVDFGLIDQDLLNFLYPADTEEKIGSIMAQYNSYL
jgi:hypothetical protein